MRCLPLTLAALALMAGSAAAQSAQNLAAQTPTPPSLGETPAQRVARREAMPPPVLQEDEQLQAAIGSDTRPAADVARDVFRHPYETLTFWGLAPATSIVEIEPGRGGWWSAILKPYAAATGGTYTAVNRPLETMVVADGSADLIVVARSFHNWRRSNPSRTGPYLQAFFKALKPGGILAVEQHRAEEGLDAAVTAPTGYVSESYVIQAAQAAGFVLEARSELNANPKDDRDHPFGVWSLPPVRVSAPRDGVATDRPTPLTEAERAALDAIGESDRMTLRFRKPG